MRDQQIQERDDRIQSLLTAIIHTDNECREFSGELNKSRDTVEHLESELQLLIVNNKLLSNEVSTSKKTVTSLKDEVKNLQNNLSRLSDENIKLKNKMKLNKSSNESKVKEGTPRNALIMTTSMARDIKSETFNDSYTGGNVVFNRHHGGRVKKVKEALEYRLNSKNEKPDIVVFQAGGNNLRDDISPLALAHAIVGAGKMGVKSGAAVAISSILPREEFHQNLKRWETNILLRGLCKSNNLHFIENDNIVGCKHLLEDGVHLNKTGTELFSHNILNALDEISL